MQTDTTYWHKQTKDKPVFPDLLWSRPENRQHAGKLLVIGGNLHGFSAPAEAYNEGLRAGAGTVRAMLPDAIQKTVGGFFENASFAPSTPSGSFSQEALAELLDQSNWASGVLLAGDFGRNSETAVLLEKFVTTYNGQLTITHDALNYFLTTPHLLLKRPHTVIVASMDQLQKLALNAQYPNAITLGMDFIKLVDILHDVTAQFPVSIVVKQHKQMCVASAGQVSSTALQNDIDIWRVKTAAHASVWWLQNPEKVFEALTISVL
jgi:NAD(P)H-hydrate repair Nnr-like enzyme with NAD(P)H-hydrate dehydratase domain